MKLQEALSITRLMKYQDNGRREGMLARMLLDLEDKQRREDLSLWKDTLELKLKLPDEYRQQEAILRRAKLLQGG